MALTDDQQRVRRIVTAVLAEDFDLARQEIADAPDPAHLAETTFMLMKPMLEVIGGLNGMSPQDWWSGFMLYMESHP